MTLSHSLARRIFLASLFISGSLGLTSCKEKQTEAVKDNTAEVEQYYKDNSDFFTFSTIEDLPEDLSWENGSDLPEFSSPAAKKGGTMHSYIPSFPRTLRMIGPDANGSFRGILYDSNIVSLISLHPNQNAYYPGTASAWALSEDKKTVYFKLDPDARYSDGTPITADDYFFLFYFMRSTHVQAPWYNNWYSDNYTNITKYDDYTLSISVPHVMPDPYDRVSGIFAMPRHFFNNLKDYPQRYQWKFPPTTGAYEVKESNIKKGDAITLTRVQNWWAKDKKYYRYRYNPDKIHYKVIRDDSKAFEAFRRGEIDMFALQLSEYWYVKSDIPEVKNGYIQRAIFYNDVPRPTYGLYLNEDKSLLNNQDIRTGLQYASNFDQIIEFYFRGDWTRLKTGEDGYGPYVNPALQARPYSPEKAREYFAKAGFTQAGKDGILLNKQGQRLSFTLTSGYPQFEPVFPILKEEAEKAGVELNIELLDPTTAFKKILEKNHEIVFMGWKHVAPTYPSYWEGWHSDNAHKPQTNNVTNTDIPELDILIDKYDNSGNETELIELSHQIQEKIHDFFTLHIYSIKSPVLFVEEST